MLNAVENAQPTPAASAVDLQRARRQKAAGVEPGRVDRLPPHALEAEQGVLGCLLLSPREAIGACLEKFKRGQRLDDSPSGRFQPERRLRPEAEVFYDPRHQTLFDLLVEMYDGQEAIDQVTVGQRLKDRRQLDAVGGFAYLSSLMDGVPSAANLDFYADIVREKALLRRMIHTCTHIVGRAYEAQDNVDQLLDEVERDVLRITEEQAESSLLSMRDLVHKAIGQVEEFHRGQGQLTGIGTGFRDLDQMTSGLHGGELVVIAARPSMGKTSLAMNIAEHVALELKLPVGVFSLEMTAESLVLRLLCSRARVNLRSVRQGFLVERDFPKLTDAASVLGSAPLHIDDTPGLSILQVRARARRLHAQFGVKLFVIDYLQLLHSTARRAEQNRQQEIADISSGVKALAKELAVPVIVLSQLNREPEKREPGAKPRLSDLRESGAIEQDADLVALLYKPGSGDEDEASPGGDTDGVAVNLLIAKQRNGPTGDVPLTFLRGFTRFESASHLGADDVPAE